MKFLTALAFVLNFFSALAQTNQTGTITGTVQDDSKKPLEGVTISLVSSQDSSSQSTSTAKDGSFFLGNIALGYYQLVLSYVGHTTLTIDSIYLREERYSLNLNDLALSAAASANMNEIVIYAEKPLIQSKDGNITFNAAESPLSAGSNASDLLATVPLISKDPSGKLLVRGKEPKILIDDKPVELNLQQLQDLLESMPGSAIEKIEVLTNPPPQYANESGVINIVTKKGRAGRSGRISVYAGTRGEKGANASYNYRRQGLSISIYAGGVKTNYEGNSYSIRENKYADSINHFKTNTSSYNTSVRPNFRTNIDFDINKNHAINFVLHYNQGNSTNEGITEYRNLNRLDELYRVSKRNIQGLSDSYNPNMSFNYTFRTKKPGEVLRFFSNFNYSAWENDRNLLLEYFTPAFVFLNDSAQVQNTTNKTHGYNFRASYDVPLRNQKTFVSLGSYFINSNSRIIVDAAYKRKADNEMIAMETLSNNFYFHQYITNGRASLKQILDPGFSISSGIAAETTNVTFELFKTDSSSKNSYWDFLPFFSLNKTWEDVLNLRVSYRKNIRRPGINEQNPTIDYTDPYNIRFGNPELEASVANNFDIVVGKTKKNFYANLGLGYNMVKDIFSQIRTPVSDSKTEITWQNISDRKEYEISSWSGYTFWKKLRMNASASYTYNKYINTNKNSSIKFRNGGSLASNFNASYVWKDLYSVTGNMTYNRFANPQGTVRSNMSLNVGAQAKIFQKKITVSVNLVDPFNQQEYRSFTYGTGFTQENHSLTKTKNLRLTIGYNFLNAQPKKNVAKDQLKNILQKKTH